MAASREPCHRCTNLQTTIDRLALELARERAAHRLTTERLDRAERRALRWRRVAQMIHSAATGRDTHQETP